LFGAIRFKGPLPWDNDFDIAVLTEEIDKMDEIKFLKA